MRTKIDKDKYRKIIRDNLEDMKMYYAIIINSVNNVNELERIAEISEMHKIAVMGIYDTEKANEYCAKKLGL